MLRIPIRFLKKQVPTTSGLVSNLHQNQQSHTKNMSTATFERDARSASRASKRDRDHREKWKKGTRYSPSSGVSLSRVTGEPEGGTESQRKKILPEKQRPGAGSHRTHRNQNVHLITGKVNTDQHNVSRRWTRKAEDSFECRNHHTLYPPSDSRLYSTLVKATGADRIDGSTVILALSSVSSGTLELGGLVEHAEKKWENIQTERIVKDEYEVLDHEGETTVLSKGKGKRRTAVAPAFGDPGPDEPDDDFDFELI